MKVLKTMVEDTLRNDEASRNSDIRLTQEVWKRFYRSKVYTASNGKDYVSLDDLFDLPREDNIKRIRATFQNDKKMFLPTNPEVAKKRGWKEEEWRSFLGYNPELRKV